MATNFFNLGFKKTSLSENSRDSVTWMKIRKIKGKERPENSFSSIILYFIIIPLVVSVPYLGIKHFSSLTMPPSNSDNAKYFEKYFALEDSIFPVLLVLAVLAVLAVILAILAGILHFLRKLANPLYWEIACWFLIAIGILIRPVVLGVDVFQATISGTLVAGCISLVIFPAVMRFLNNLKPMPGLAHVALPFSLGFFLDVAQLLVITYVPKLSV